MGGWGSMIKLCQGQWSNPMIRQRTAGTLFLQNDVLPFEESIISSDVICSTDGGTKTEKANSPVPVSEKALKNHSNLI